MIPILYGKSETAFTSNGLGRLTDCISCLVTEERNGIFECEFQYPVTGKLYNEMVTNGGIVSVTHDDAKDRQPFDIYKYSAPINGIVTFNARHISYRLSGIVVKPYTAASCALALNGIVTNSVSTNPFTFWTDKAVTTTFKLETPTSAKAILVGQQGSILDVYGKGEYKFDKFEVKLYTNRGTNSGVTIRYGKNLSDTLVENDNGEYYNAIVPYWKGQDGTLVTLTGWYVVQTGETLKYCIPVDFSSEFETQPTELELQTKAAAYLANNTPWLPKENVKVDFVQLWNTDEYKDVAVLERVKLCDTVAIYYPALGLTNSSAKVIKVVYDTLLERYSSIELGEPQQTLAQAIIQPYAQAIASISDKASVSFMEEAIQAATDLIAGGLGGHVVINRNADGEPEEILIMDTDNTSTAVNVWRWNLNGLAHSHSGYNGPFDDIAITQDGKINASMITAGTLSANRISGGTIDASDVTITNLNASNITSGTMSADKISGGTLTVGGVNNINGIIRILDANGNVAGYITNSQFYTSWLNGSILEEASLTAGTLTLRTDGTQSVVVTRDTQGGGAIELYDAGGNRRITLDMLNGSTFEDTTINGVLDVTQRRCSRTRIGGGWHRVLTFAATSAAYARGATGNEIVFHITRRRATAGEETHEIKMLCQYDNVSFVDEVSKSLSGDQLITQIRYTYDSTHGYVDIYVTDAADYVTVDYEVYCEPSYQELYTSSNLEYVMSDEAGTVMTTYTFVANGDNNFKTVYLSAQTINSGYFVYQDSAVTSNSKLQVTQLYAYGETMGLFYIAQPQSGYVVVYCRTNSGAYPTDGSKTSVFLTIDNR